MTDSPDEDVEEIIYTVEPRPVTITWRDHYSFGGESWVTFEKLKSYFETDGMTVKTTGFLVHENRDVYIMVSTYEENMNFTQGFVIIKSCVEEIVYHDGHS